jgi:hypothetical protein
MFVVLYTVHRYICVFMTCSTSCCLNDTLMDPWNVYVCVCVCVYVCVFFNNFIDNMLHYRVILHVLAFLY